MSVSRLLRSQRLAKKAATRNEGDAYDEAVRRVNESFTYKNGLIVFPDLPPPEAPAEPQPVPQPQPVPAVAPPVEAKVEPEPEPLRQWWEERCRWRARTAADDADHAENDNSEYDDPLGIYR